MVGAFVLADNKERFNIDGCLWNFGRISLSLKAVNFGHINKKYISVSVFGILQNGHSMSLS